jgi:diaminopimelate decarboxylase
MTELAVGARSEVDIVVAEGVETPAYVYDLAEVRANTDRLITALPDGTGIYYSLKANPHPAVLRVLRAASVAAEVCSPGELSAALDAGWPADEILYTGPAKRDRDVTNALRLGVREFCVDSPAGLDQLDRLAGESDVDVHALLRINDDRPAGGGGLAMTGVASQFGADTTWVLAEPARFGDRRRVRVVGLHLYMGTNLATVDDLLAQFTQSVGTAVTLSEALAPHVTAIEVFDLGGGFGAPFAKNGPPVDLAGLRSGLAELLDSQVVGWRDGRPRIVFESGRYLVGTAGTLITQVLDVKQSHGKDIVVLESGINHLGGMSGLRRLPPINPDLAGLPGTAATSPAIVTGPLCTPLDSWSRSAPLPPLQPGDLLAVPNVGAYGLYASLIAFLGHPAPVEIAVDGDQPVHASRLTIVRKEHAQ